MVDLLVIVKTFLLSTLILLSSLLLSSDQKHLHVTRLRLLFSTGSSKSVKTVTVHELKIKIKRVHMDQVLTAFGFHFLYTRIQLIW